MPIRRRSLLAALASAPALGLRAGEARGYTPPGPADRVAALGPLDELSPALRAAFAPDIDDLPLPRPRRGDWLDEHHERGQSYAAFVRGGYTRVERGRGTIVVVPIVAGESPRGPGELGGGAPSVATLCDFVGRYFSLPARAGAALPIDEAGATRRGQGRRTQYRSGDLLEALKRRLPRDAYCVIGVTDVDLYPGPGWNFVFGEATFHERVGVHSFARYDPAFYGEARGAAGERRILARGLKVMAHEVGHMVSMHHCVHFHCVMNGSNNLDEADRAPFHLCPVCRRKLHAALPHDPITREASLAEFYRGQGLVVPAERHERRVAMMQGVAAAGERAREVAAALRGLVPSDR